MGLFSSGYVPSERDKYMRGLREQDYLRKRADSQFDAARKIRDTIPALIDKEQEKVKRDAQAVVSGIRKSAEAEEKRLLTTPVKQYSGGAHGNPDPIVVWHWRVPMPESINLSVEGTKRSDAGPVLVLQPGGGIGAEDIIPAALRARLGGRDGFAAWATEVNAVLGEMESRYPILADLRDDAKFAKMLSATGVNRDEKGTDVALEERGAYGTVYTRPRTITHVPVLTAVDITPEGLELVFKHDDSRRAGDISGAVLDRLRSAFNANGIHNARNLVALDGDDGELILSFRDAPSHFPAGIAFLPAEPPKALDEAKKRYPSATWPVGVDARGNEIMPTVKSTRHCIAAGQPGVGKSVWVRGVIDWFRVGLGAEVYCGDGKGSDYASLAGQPNVRMVSTSAAQHLRMVREVCDELERRRAEAAVNKRTDPNPYDRYSPILLVLDEFGLMKSEINDLDKKNALETFMDDLAKIIKVGREARIVLLLAAQDVYADTIPVALQNQFGLAVLLGVPGERTIQGDFVPERLRDTARRIGARLVRPGAAMYIERETERVIEVQTPYNWSPGSTPLDAALTGEQRAVWADAKARAEALPWFYPRLGINAAPGWEKSGTTAIVDTELVVMTDRNGNLLPGAERFDPMDESFVGAGGASTVKPRPRTWYHDTLPSTPEVPVTEGSPTPEEAANMTDAEKAAWMHDHAVRMGWVPADTKTPSSGSTEPEGDTPKAAPKKTAPKRGGGDI
ncbi:DNA segregation ATPase, FtsK/SpoIIIE family [Mycobacteroides abscessus subsp. abscessus]|uniref:type IV secretory system conjugative DNA transfer family protein n=1 Tax=Mycobacteroides abscessus TaxID=36809 RepID=UPI0009A628C0|nr:FtsK/SpoIIIE domain-containing protein [Mycobacteroides abscessus]SLH66601.1 DNA segregation ATPase, FtsK/SpoIIIE family [Mycobacteroides abscessus subsp. abscessus]